MQSLFKKRTDGNRTKLFKMSTTKYTPRLAKRYQEEIVPALKKKFEYSSVMQVPKLQKICINQGVNGATSDKKLVDIALTEMTAIAGQKAVASHAKVSVVLDPRLLEDRIRIAGRALRARMRVVPIRALRVHHLLQVRRAAGVVHLSIRRISFR